MSACSLSSNSSGENLRAVELLTCGTGGWTGPKPGDPDNFSILQATAAFGGIDVTWTYPLTNPFAVAHTLVYRATSSNFATATLLATVDGNFYYDKTVTETPVEYFYWIKFVSINGTYGELIGPDSATARPTIEAMIEMLTGRIDKGVLATALKEDIDKITTLEDGLTQEALYRQEDDAVIAEAFNGLQATVEDAVSLVLEETTARSTADSALASQITTVQSQLGNNLASAQVNLQTNINTVNGKVTAIGALYTAKVSVNGLVGGFGVYNDGSEVQAGFDVDTFWIGRTNANKRKPFIIADDIVYIDEGAINKLTFTKLRDMSGAFMVEDGRIKADYIKVNAASIVDGSITNAKIQNGAINNAKIEDGAITNAKIGNAQITNAKIGNAEIDTLKIAGNSVTVSGQVAGSGWNSFYLNAPHGGVINIVACNLGGGGDSDYLYVHVNGGLVNQFRGMEIREFVTTNYESGAGYEAIARRAAVTEVNVIGVGGGNHHISIYSAAGYRVLGILSMR